MNEQEKNDQKEKKDTELVNSMQDFKNMFIEKIEMNKQENEKIIAKLHDQVKVNFV